MKTIHTIFDTGTDTGAKLTLGMDDDAKLYVNGQEVQTKSVVSLRWFELLLASAAAVGALASGASDVIQLVCS